MELQVILSDERLKNGCLLPAASPFRCQIPGIPSPCVFSTMADVTIYPISVCDFSYITRDLEQYGLSEVSGTQAAIRISLQLNSMIHSDHLPDELTCYLNIPESEASLIQCQILADNIGVFVSSGSSYQKDDDIGFEIPDYDWENFLDTSKSLRGIASILKLLAYPALFKFVTIKGLRKAFQRMQGQQLDIVIALKQRMNCFINKLNSEHLKLWCVPTVNLFRKRSDRTEFNGQYEQHLVPDRTAPQNFEVYKIISVEAYNERNEVLFHCDPCYHVSGALQNMKKGHNYFVQHRTEHILGSVTNKRSSYVGTEVYFSITGEKYLDEWENIRQFCADTLCTNRDLPLLLRQNDVLTPPQGAPVSKASFISLPGVPHTPVIRNGDVNSWRIASHVIHNVSSTLWLKENIRVETIRELVRSYDLRNDDGINRLAEGIVAINSNPHSFRFISHGSVYFEQGWKIEVTLDEQACEGTGVFIFGSVINTLLQSFTSLNTCLEVVLHTDKRKNIISWMS